MGVMVFFLNIGRYIICEAHYNFVSASGLNPRLVCGSGNTICKRVKAFTSCTAVQAQGHSGRRSTGFLLAHYVNTDLFRQNTYLQNKKHMLTCQGGLVVTDLITSPVVSWEGWETTPPPPQHRGSAVILCSTTGVVRPLCSCGDLLLSSARHCLRLVDVDWNTFSLWMSIFLSFFFCI